MQKTKQCAPMATVMLAITLFLSVVLISSGCKKNRNDENLFPMVNLPGGFKIEKVTGGLTYPTSLTWDNQGNMYVAEAGGGLNPENLAPIRILRIDEVKLQRLQT